METNIYGNANFITKTDEEYFICFYQEEIKTYLPPRHKSKTIDQIIEIDLEKALTKWYNKHIFDLSKLSAVNIKSNFHTHRIIVKCLDIITECQLENVKITDIIVSKKNCAIIRKLLLNYNRELCLKTLYFIKEFDSIQTKTEILRKNIRNIFVSEEAKDWFITTLEEKFTIRSGKTRGLNAFVSALLNNNHVKKHILIKSCSQRTIVEYLNSYYGREDGIKLIKNHTKLSNPTRYNDEVNKLIKHYIDSTKQLHSTFLRNK